MTRLHPQSANAPEAKPTEFCAAFRYAMCEAAKALFTPTKRYGVGVPPGEPFRLTDAQLREWRKRERRCQ